MQLEKQGGIAASGVGGRGDDVEHPCLHRPGPLLADDAQAVDQQLRHLSRKKMALLVTASVPGSRLYREAADAKVPFSPGLYTDQAELILSNQF